MHANLSIMRQSNEEESTKGIDMKHKVFMLLVSMRHKWCILETLGFNSLCEHLDILEWKTMGV